MGMESKIYRNFNQGLLNGTCKIKLGEFIMYKKVISIGISFLMLFEFSAFNTFAKGGDGDFKAVGGRNTEKPKYLDYCKGFPKNKYNKSENIRCEIKSEMPSFKADNESFALSIPQLGKTGEIDVHMWKYNGLAGLASEFEDWMKNTDKASIKRQFTTNFLEETNKLFDLNSKEEAIEIINRWVKDSNYSKPFIDSIKDEITDWVKKCKTYEDTISGDVDKTLLGGGIGALIGGAGAAGFGGLAGVGTGAGAAAVAAETVPLLAGAAGGGAAAGAGVAVAGTGAIALAPIVAFAALTEAVIAGAGGVYYGYRYSKERKLNKKALEALKKSAKQKRKWDVYSWALENILRAINNNEWVDNDLLRAEISYEKALPYARTSFINVGIGTPKNITAIFENLSRTLSNLKENLKNDRANRKNNKEEL